jgi:adenosylmethionine-8-amino-7-oxononanoate aminotransferase
MSISILITRIAVARVARQKKTGNSDRSIAMGTRPMQVSAEALVKLDQRHILHPLRGPESRDTCVIVRGDGCRVWTAEGQELLDATAGGLWATLVGHGRHELAEVAAQQMAELEYFTSFWNYGNDQSILLAAKIAELAPEGLDRTFFCCGGSEANDTAIKLARNYFYRRGEPDRNWIISRQGAYHGLAYGGGTATGLDDFREGFGPLLPNVEHLTPPWPYQVGLYGDDDATDFLISELEQTIARIGANKIAAMVGEPVIGVGGVLVPPPDYWPRVREVLREHGILLIADEVVTGFGRGGHWFASEALGMEPDMIVFAKGVTSGYLPLGGVIMREEVAEASSNTAGGFHHGFTYFGHPVCCAVARANIEIIEQEGLLDAAVRNGEALVERLAPLDDAPHVGEIRHFGSMIGIEFVADQRTREPLYLQGAAEAMQVEHGVIAREIGSVIALSPPLVMDDDEIRTVAEAIVDVAPRAGADGVVR